MTNGKRMAIGVIGLMLFLAGAGNAQEPGRRSQKPPLDAKALEDPKKAEAAAAFLESAYQGQRPPEAVRMLIALLRGSRMGPGEGWFGPAQTRYSWEWLAAHCGVDPAKGGIPRSRFRGSEAWFARLDRDKDGTIAPGDLDWSDRSPYVQMSYMANRLFRKLNARGDGRLTKDELLQFFDKAASGKERLSSDDFRDALLGNMSGGFLPGDAPKTDVLIRGLFAGEIGSMHEGPKLNEPAPTFTLKTVDGKDSVQLAKRIGSKPVVLVFGNFTCGPFRSFYPDVETVYQRYKNDAHFLMVYVREAHPTDGWKMESNARVGVAVKQPATFAERVAVGSQFCARLKPTMPVAIDEINDPVGNAYSGMPARLYVIDRSGKVAYKSGRGPFGFRVGEMEQALVMLMLDQNSPATKTSERLPMLTNEEAWQRLPGAPATVQPLPAWARLLAGPLPLTTARMLELDALHRSGDRLEPKLRGLVRWAAADANRCVYAKAVAAADLRRAGATEIELQALAGDPSGLSPEQRAASTFARKMMREAYAVTDEEVKQLLRFFGEERVVALVALLAHASFQDRLFLATNVQVEPGGPLPPLTVRFTKPPSNPPANGNPPGANGEKPAFRAKGAAAGVEWLALQERLDWQRSRAGRIRVPSKEEVRQRLGDGHPGLWQSDIHWSRVCYGNQPELTEAWFACAAAFRQEARLDPLFQQSLFWIVTRSLQCFY